MSLVLQVKRERRGTWVNQEQRDDWDPLENVVHPALLVKEEAVDLL